ncbi:MAG: NfeD family protein [Treponema sp.]|nr:NfeD family protein [Treponema sp.]
MDSIISVLADNLPWFWVAVTIICVVIESLTLALTTIWFGISAFVMVFLAFTPLPFTAQLFIFVALALLLLIFTRPLVKQKLNQKKIATNYERVIGQIAVVTKKITVLEKGSVKINGMEWTAAVREDIVLEEGSKCIVEEIAGVTAYVKQIYHGD